MACAARSRYRGQPVPPVVTLPRRSRLAGWPLSFFLVMSGLCCMLFGMITPPPIDGTAAPQPKVKKRLKIEPEDNSRLSFLMAQLPELEVGKKDAEEKLAAHKKAIQQEIAALVDDPADMPDVFDIPADPYGAHPAYTLSSREGAWRLNTEAMKNEDPETYVKWAVKGQPYWELKRVTKNRVHRG